MAHNLLPEPPCGGARRVHVPGARAPTALLPEHTGPTEIVPVSGEPTSGEAFVTDGMGSHAQILAETHDARETIARHDTPKILTPGEDCTVSAVLFTELAAHYGDDLATVQIDSHPDIDTLYIQYPGYHAMAISHTIGTGDVEVMEEPTAFVSPSRLILAGLHSWAGDGYPNIATWRLRAFNPADLGNSVKPLLKWLEVTGCSRIVVHLDVGTVGAGEV